MTRLCGELVGASDWTKSSPFAPLAKIPYRVGENYFDDSPLRLPRIVTYTLVTMKTVTTRIPEEDEELLAELEAELTADRSEVLRRLIRQGLEDWRRERALEQLRDHEVTLRRAAEIADVTYVEMLSIAGKEGIDVGYTTDDLERDLDRI